MKNSERKKNILFENDNCVFEKKNWISITGLCNNNCIFCLDGDRKDKHHKSAKDVKKKIKEGRKKGCTKLILSGGEPTIHPHIIDFVSYGKELGYNKIQVISNGRMFSYRRFAEEIISAGVTEVTFSLHGHTKKLHETLTNIPGSFDQITQGIYNVSRYKHIIINADTVITGLNYKYLPEIVKFLINKGISELNLMGIVPFGNAYRNRNKIFYDFNKMISYIHRAIDVGIENKVGLWFSRFPAKYLEGYEQFMEDSYKMIDDVKGMSDTFLKNTTKPKCKGVRCKYCSINNLCDDILTISKDVVNKKKHVKNLQTKNKIIITKNNHRKLPEIAKKLKFKKIIFEFPEPLRRINKYKVLAPRMSDVLPHLKKAINSLEDYAVKNIPKCLFNGKVLRDEKPHSLKKYLRNSKLNYELIAADLAKKLKIKRISCNNCKFDNECDGIFQKYVRIYGFDEFKPVR